jgi:hypothetical protein
VGWAITAPIILSTTGEELKILFKSLKLLNLKEGISSNIQKGSSVWNVPDCSHTFQPLRITFDEICN